MEEENLSLEQNDSLSAQLSKMRKRFPVHVLPLIKAANSSAAISPVNYIITDLWIYTTAHNPRGTDIC